MQQNRYEAGLQLMNGVVGDSGKHTREFLRAVAPDFERLLVEFAFGDIISRPILDLKTREIATIAALTALGFAIPQLKTHINGAINVGCTKDEIIEIMMQMSVYAGFPAALNGLSAANEVFSTRNI